MTALKHFDVYVSGSAPVVVFTDHNPLLKFLAVSESKIDSMVIIFAV